MTIVVALYLLWCIVNMTANTVMFQGECRSYCAEQGWPTHQSGARSETFWNPLSGPVCRCKDGTTIMTSKPQFYILEWGRDR